LGPARAHKHLLTGKTVATFRSRFQRPETRALDWTTCPLEVDTRGRFEGAALTRRVRNSQMACDRSLT
jgi:hypothetical protein